MKVHNKDPDLSKYAKTNSSRIMLEGKYRFLILLLSTACVSMMLANILALNFTILCMTEEKFHWKNFTFDLGQDVFQKFDLESAKNSTNPDDHMNVTSRDLVGYKPEIVQKLKEYLFDKIHELKNFEMTNVDVKRMVELQKARIEDFELTGIHQSGQIHGRFKVVYRKADHYYTATEKSILVGVIAAGALFFIFPINWSIKRFGCRTTFTVVGLISALFTSLCPLAAHFGVVSFVIVRFMQGIGYAACMQVVGCVTASWAKLNENGLFNGALTGFIQLAPVISMPMSGLLCASSLGWRAVYYVHAMLTLVLIVIWWYLYRDSPSELSHKVSDTELREIQQGKIVTEKRKHNKIPIKQICTTVSVWAVWVAAIGNMYSIQMVVVFSPTFIREVLKYPLVNVGFASAIPTLLQFVVKLSAGTYSDKLKLGETAKVRIFNSIAFIGMGTFMILLACVGSEETRVLAITFLISTAGILGFNTGGFFKSATLVGRQHSHFVNAIVQVIMCTAMLTMPFFVYALTPNNTPFEWSIVFIVHALLLFATNTIFCIFGQGIAAPFTQVEDSISSTTLSKDENVNKETIFDDGFFKQ